MVKASRKHRATTKARRRITAHNDAGKASRKDLQKNLSRKIQKKLDAVKRKRRKRIARQARLRKQRESAQIGVVAADGSTPAPEPGEKEPSDTSKGEGSALAQ